MATKPDAAEIVAHLDHLATTLDGSRSWWPKYAFHSAHVENAAGVLNDGFLLCRSSIASTTKLAKDSASAALIAGLPASLRRWVRLYFRPRTPTQYRNQGLRPVQHLYQNAQMPVPVYLLFDAKKLLVQSGVSYTRGRLGHGVAIGNDAAFFKSIPFDKVYHDSGVGQLGATGRSDILNARHAEVLVRDRLDLEHLRFVVCRSAPEQATLLHLLTPTAREKWRARVILEGPRRFFFTEFGTYVEHAELSSTATRLRFYSGVWPGWRGPFHLEIAWSGDGWNPKWSYPEFVVSNEPLAFTIKPSRERYTIAVRMDGNLVYTASWEEPKSAEVFG